VKPTPLERARRYLATMPPAISGQHGHDQTFKAACILVNGFGLDQHTAVGLLLADYNPRCQPPWRERELLHKVKDAARASHRKPRGYLLSQFQQVSAPPERQVWPVTPKVNQQVVRASTPNAGEINDRNSKPENTTSAPCEMKSQEVVAVTSGRVPFVSASGDLVIPFDSPEKYHFWKRERQGRNPRQEILSLAQIREEVQSRKGKPPQKPKK
jgi:hypothetical protein